MRVSTPRQKVYRSILFLALVAGCGLGDPAESVEGAPPVVAPPGVDASAPDASSVPDGAPTTKLDAGMKPSPPHSWTLKVLGEMPDAWFVRDGAEMVQLPSGRILMIGGWSIYDPWLDALGQPSRLTNEVWASDDLGVTWFLLLPHLGDPGTSRFLPAHVQCLIESGGHAVFIGGDWEGGQYGDVWVESNNGATWTRITDSAPVAGRSFAMCASYKGAIYVMGGQISPFDVNTALNDVWRSTNGGATWTQLANAAWSPRGIVNRLTEHDGKLYLVGGGRYADSAEAYNGVFSFDGVTWQTVLPDGHAQFAPSAWHTLASLDGRLWVFNGYDFNADTNLARAIGSDDDGTTWASFAPGSGGVPSHADAVVTLSDRIIRVSGDLDGKTIYQIAPAP